MRVANGHMARAPRTISVQRGVSPAGFTLVSFGGAGGLHVCALAEALGMKQAMVPVYGGVLSALGMLVAAPGRQLSRTWLAPLDSLEDREVQDALDRLAAEALASMESEGVSREQCRVAGSLDVRYQGQSYTLNIPWNGMAGVAQAFHALHARRYGHSMALPLELVNLRVAVRGEGLPVQPVMAGKGKPGSAFEHCAVHGENRPVACYSRDRLVAGQEIGGPALIVEQVATTWLARGWICRVDGMGNLVLRASAFSE